MKHFVHCGAIRHLRLNRGVPDGIVELTAKLEIIRQLEQ